MIQGCLGLYKFSRPRVSKLFYAIALTGLLALSFSAFAKEENCNQKCAQSCGTKGNLCMTNCIQRCAPTDSKKRTEVPASFSDPRGIRL